MHKFDPARSRAVLVGFDNYGSMSNLPAVSRNLTGMAEVLTSPSLGRLPQKNCAVVTGRVGPAQLGKTLADAAHNATDLLLFYFSGHGIPGRHGDELYLALPETDPEMPAYSAIPFKAIRDQVINSPAAVRVMIIDCCFSGRAASPQMAADFPLAEELNVEGVVTLTASPANRVALSGGYYSEFTGQFIALLNKGVPGGDEMLTLHAIYREIKRRMARRNLPDPQYSGTGLASDLAFVPNLAAGSPDANPEAEATAPPAAEPRLLAFGSLRGLCMPSVPTYSEAAPVMRVPSSLYQPTSKNLLLQYAERKTSDWSVDARQRDADERALAQAGTQFSDFLSAVANYCLGVGADRQGVSLEEQTPDWVYLRRDADRARTFEAYRQVSHDIVQFISERYRSFPVQPQWRSVGSTFQWMIRSNVEARWAAFDLFLQSIAQFCEPPVSVTELELVIPQLRPYLTLIAEIRAENVSYAEKQKPKPNKYQLIERADRDLGKLADATASMEAILRQLLANGSL